jgi:LysM repeat protein
MTLSRILSPVIFLLAAATLLVSCSLIEGDEGAGNARVTGVLMSSQIGSDGQLVNPTNLFAPGTREVRASVAMEGVETGMKVTGKWYQLGTVNAGAEGFEASGSDITLDASTILEGGRARVFFTLSIGGQGLSAETPWLLRVFVNDDLVNTSGFVVTSRLATGGPQGGNPPASPTPRTYTVVAGDTLTSVAQRLLPQGENVNNFVQQIATLNNIPTTAALTPGQTLRIP